MEKVDDYRDGQEIFLLLTKEQASAVVEAWIESQWTCDLRVCRSKQKPGMYVVRTFNVVWASYIIKWHGVEQATYK